MIPFLGAGQNQTVTFTVQGSFTATGGCINAPIAVTSAGCEPNGTDICVNVPVCSSTQCSMPYTSVDMGNLLNACYPTLTNNPGHALTGVAWLGPQITGETDPHLATDEASRDCFGFGRDLPSLDPGTDGVAFFGAPWMPCTQVTVAVMVTGGPNYAEFLQNGGHLYLSAWKNGNYPNDADFDDELCGGAGSEWLIHDAIVTPSPIPYLFTFMDPGVFDHGIYRGVFRFRLGSHEFGRYGYGTFVADPEHGCPVNMANDINGGFDCVGEVEDYDMCDFQLAVELTSFNANPADGAAQLSWITASEAQNDHFEIMRDGQAVAQIRGAGHSTTESLTYNYTDNGLTNGNSYNYSVVAVDINGGRQQLSTASVTPIAGAATVTKFALSQNFPNPFNPTTSISFDLPTGSFVSLKVFNMVGQEVASLVNGNLAQGRHSISFDAKDLPSGLYIYRMNAGSFNATKKMLLMK